MGGPAALPPAPAAAPAAAAPAAASAVPVADAKIAQLPERLQDIARPVVLTGTVAGQTPEGLTRVRTAAGEILLDTPAPLPADRPVTIQLTPAQPQPGAPAAKPAAVVLLQASGAPAGTPAPGAPAQGAAGATPAVILPAQPPVSAPLPGLPALVPGVIVPALVLAANPKPPAAAGSAAASAQPTVPGTQVAAAPQGAPDAPAAGGSARPAATAPATPPAASPAGPAAGRPQPGVPVGLGGDAAHPGAETPTLTAPAKDLPDLPKGATVALKILAVTLPSAQSATAQPGTAQPATIQLGAAQPGPPAAPLGSAAQSAMPQQPLQPQQPQPLSPPAAGQSPGQPATPSPPSQEPAVSAQAGRAPSPAAPSPQPTPDHPTPDQRPPAGAGRPEGEGSPGRGTGQGASPEAPPDRVPAELPDAPLIQGTVAGATPQGRPILATKLGMLALAVPASLPQGTQVTAALTSAADALTAAAPPTGLLGPVTERDWPAMRQLVAALAGLDRMLAQTVLAAIPQPNRKLGAAASFFLAAIRGGDARGWLGEEAAGALDRAGRGDLLAQLERDFKVLQQQAAEPLPGDWRLYTLPMLDSHGLRPVQVHIHPLRDEEEARSRDGDRPGSRFLIDVDLSRLGPLQLDGLVRPNQFDLILRSHAALPGELKVELIQIFADSVRAVGFTGGLSFQSGAKSWVKLTRAGKAGLGVNA